MLKKSLFIITFVLLTTQVYSQVEQVGWISKFGAAGGFTPMWTIPDLKAINEVLPSFGVDNLPEGGMLVLGGGGYVYVMFIDNLRIGGMGFSGSVSRSSTLDNFNKEVIYSVGGGAVTIEYTLPFIKKVAVSVGTMIGGGSVEIEVYRNQGNFNWTNLWDEASDNTNQTNNISRRLKNNFFSISPTVNVDIPINRFIAFRLGGGYIFSIGNDWKIENDQPLNNVPSSLNGDSFFIQTGIFLGFFAF